MVLKETRENKKLGFFTCLLKNYTSDSAYQTLFRPYVLLESNDEGWIIINIWSGHFLWLDWTILVWSKFACLFFCRKVNMHRRINFGRLKSWGLYLLMLFSSFIYVWQQLVGLHLFKALPLLLDKIDRIFFNDFFQHYKWFSTNSFQWY